MRLRSRTVGDAEDDQPSVASGLSSNMDENSSTGAVFGSPAPRRSWSTTYDSQEASQNPAVVASNTAHPSLHDQEVLASGQQRHREQHPCLTDYETPAHTEFEEYPTSIPDSQWELYNSSPPQAHRSEETPAYVQTTSSSEMTYCPYINANPQTPQPPPRTIYQTSHYTPYFDTPTQPSPRPTSNPTHFIRTPISQAPSRSFNYGEHLQPAPYTSYEQLPYGHPPAALTYPTLLPFQSHQSPTHSPRPSRLQSPQVQASVPLIRYASDNEDSWSPAAQTNPETRKRRFSEADETIDGFRNNKLRTELDELEKGGEGSQSQVQSPRKRRRGGRGGKRKARPRFSSRSRDKGNGRGRDKRDRDGNGGRGEAMTS